MNAGPAHEGTKATKHRRPPLCNCDECRFGEIRETRGNIHLLCAHGHTPPFVVPDWPQIQSGEWGWLRRCRDFSARPQRDPDLQARTSASAQADYYRGQEQAAWRAQAVAILGPPAPP